MRSFIGFCSLGAIFLFAASVQAQGCENQIKDLAIKNIVASAGLFANLRNRPGSISYESNAIFEEAKARVPTLPVPENFCKKGCAPKKDGAVFFRSAPSKVLSDYEDAEHCNLLQKVTSRKPLQYQTDQIQSIEDLNTWIGDLSQGKGALGEDLYEKCDGSCSPRFEYIIARNKSGSGYNVHASVVCGPARDKDDNSYDLSSFFRWTCE